jgi:acetyl esterase
MADRTVQRLLLETVLSLPAPVLRGLAGGGVIYRDARTLSPRFQYLARTRTRPHGSAEVEPEEARTGWADLTRTLAPKLVPGVRVETVPLDAGDHTVQARLYRPEDQDATAPMLVFFHAGGGVVGDLDTSEAFCARLCAGLRTPVLSPDYRLAPEHRFPAGLEDARVAWRWARDNAARYGATGAAIGGESMGAGFAAAICQAAKAEGEEQPRLQLLVTPILDAASECASLTTYADSWPLSRDGLAWTFSHYLGPEDDPNDPRLSPLRAGDVTGLAPAVIAAAGFDPVADQAEAYARKLGAAGVAVTYRRYDSLPHAFPTFVRVAPEADAACAEIVRLAGNAPLLPHGAAAGMGEGDRP